MPSPVKPTTVIPGRGPIAPYLDVSVESEDWLKTFATYTLQVKLLPADALERKAFRLRMALLKQFALVKMKKGQAKRELRQRGGRIKIRKSIRDKYKSGTFLVGKHGMGGLVNRASKARVKVKKTVKGKTKEISRFAWADAVSKELTARNRSRSLLAASWVNKAHEQGKQPRTASFKQNLKSNQGGNSVAIDTTGNDASIVLKNFVQGVAKVSANKGIIARAIRVGTDDMKVYLQRKAERAAQLLNK